MNKSQIWIFDGALIRYYLHYLIPHPLSEEGSVPTNVRNINPGIIRKHLRVFYPFDDDAFGADVIGVDDK